MKNKDKTGIIFKAIVEFVLCVSPIVLTLVFFDWKLLIVLFIWTWANNMGQAYNRFVKETEIKKEENGG